MRHDLPTDEFLQRLASLDIAARELAEAERGEKEANKELAVAELRAKRRFAILEGRGWGWLVTAATVIVLFLTEDRPDLEKFFPLAIVVILGTVCIAVALPRRAHERTVESTQRRKREAEGRMTVARAEFDVVLNAIGEHKINAMKTDLEVTSLGLGETKDLVESAPITVVKGLSKDEAESIQIFEPARGDDHGVNNNRAMVRVRIADYGVDIEFGGSLTREDHAELLAELYRKLPPPGGHFGLLVDSRRWQPNSEADMAIFKRGILLCVERGMERSVVVHNSFMAALKAKRLGYETGTLAWTRFIDTRTHPEWQRIARDWLLHATEDLSLAFDLF